MSKMPSPEVESQTSDEQIPENTVAYSPFILKLPEQNAQMLPLEDPLLALAEAASDPARPVNNAESTSFINLQQQAKTTQHAETLYSQGSHSVFVTTKGIDIVYLENDDEYDFGTIGTTSHSPVFSNNMPMATIMTAVYPTVSGGKPFFTINPHVSLNEPTVTTTPNKPPVVTPPAPTVNVAPIIEEDDAPAVTVDTTPVVSVNSTPAPTPTVNTLPTPTVDNTPSTLPDSTVHVPTLPSAPPVVSPIESGSIAVTLPANPTPSLPPSQATTPSHHEYSIGQLWNPANLAGAVIDYFNSAEVTSTFNRAQHYASAESSFFATSLLNPAHAADAFTQTVSGYLAPAQKVSSTTVNVPVVEVANATPASISEEKTSPSFFATSLLNPAYAAEAFTQHVSSYLSSPGVNRLNPAHIADSLVHSASSTYHHLFDQKLVSLEEVQGLEQQLTSERTLLANVQSQITATSQHLVDTKSQLDGNIQHAINTYSLLEDKQLGMHELLESYAPGGVLSKFAEGFTAAWAKVNPAEVTSYLMGVTPQTSSTDVNWLLQHVGEYESRLTQASENATKLANQAASKLTGQEVSSFEQTQSILQSQRENIVELQSARDEAKMAFHMHDMVYQGQAFYDFSKSSAYQSAKFDLDQATSNFETAEVRLSSLSKTVNDVDTLQHLLTSAKSASQYCTDIQKNLSDWQTDQSALNSLISEEKSLTKAIASHESDLLSLQKQWTEQNHPVDHEQGPSLFDSTWTSLKTIIQSPSLMAQEMEDNMVVPPSLLDYAKPVTIAFGEASSANTQPLSPIDGGGLLLSQKAASRLSLEDVITQPDFFTQKIAAPVHYDSAQHINYFNTLSDVTQNARQALAKLQLREIQLTQTKATFDEATQTLELSKTQASHLEDPKSSNEGKFTNAWLGGESRSTTFFTKHAWQNKEIDSLDAAVRNRDQSQQVFDQELKNINNKNSLNLNPEGINFKSVSDALTDRMTHATVQEKAQLESHQSKVTSMADDIKTWNTVIENYKAYDIAQKNYVDSQRFYAEAQAQHENNDAILHRIQGEKPSGIPANYGQHADHGLHAHLPSLEKVGGDDCCKHHLHLDGF